MGRRNLRRVGLLVAVAIVAGAATAFGQLSSDFSSPPAPVPGGKGNAIYLRMTGAKPGEFTGPVTVTGFRGTIDVLALDMSSTPPGQTPCSGIEFRKPTDQTTPQLFLSERTNESIPTAIFTEVHKSTTGRLTGLLKITASKSTISSVHHVDSTTTGAYDDVTLTPTKVQVEWIPTGHITLYTCYPT